MGLLNQVVTKRVKQPFSVILYGVEKVGKSTFFTDAEKPIYLGAEEHGELPDGVARFKVTNWYEFEKWLMELKTEDHDYKTLVIDTLDSVETLLHTMILKESGADSMSKALGGYGRAYEKAAAQLVEIRDKYLTYLRDKKGMNIAIVAHANRIKIQDPIHNAEFDTYEMKLHKKAIPVFKEWVSCILFANHESTLAKTSNGKEFKVGDGKRVLYTEHRPGFEAGNRYHLPIEMPLEFKHFHNGYENFYSCTADILLEKISKFYDKLDKDKLKRVQTAVKNVGLNVNKLKAILNKLEEESK